MTVHDWRVILDDGRGHLTLRCARCGVTHAMYFQTTTCQVTGVVLLPETVERVGP